MCASQRVRFRSWVGFRAGLRRSLPLLACAAVLLAGATRPVLGADYYVDAGAPPGGDGSFGSPFQTIQQGLNVAGPGDNVIVRGGTYTLTSALIFPRSGTAGAPITLKAYDGESVLVERSPSSNVAMLDTFSSYITIEGIVFDGNYGTQNGMLRFRGGSHQTMRNCEVRRWGNHMVRLDSNDFLMEDCEIHHAIWPGSPSTDAHCLHTQTGFRHTFRRCEVYMATGDLWQGSTDGPWGDIVFEDCDLHIELADGDCPGIAPGTPITENHLDTKDSGSTNFNVTVRNSIVRGSRASRTSVGGALNLKKNISGFYIYNNLIYDNKCAFRLRYPSTNYLIYNNMIYDNDQVFRLEDGIRNLRIYNNTIYDTTRLEYDAGALPGSPLIWKNNIFAVAASCDWHGAYSNNLFWNVPGGWSDPNAVVADPQFADAAGADFHLLESSPAINAGAAVAEVLDDYDGDPRPVGAAYDIGADEFRFAGDADADGDVDFLDVNTLVNAFGSVPGDPNWDPSADFDGNGQVDVFDAITVVNNFGKTL